MPYTLYAEAAGEAHDDIDPASHAPPELVTRVVGMLCLEWGFRTRMLMAAVQGLVIGVLVAAIQQVLSISTKVMWVDIPDSICSSHSPTCSAAYNIGCCSLLWGLAGLALIFGKHPGPKAPGMPVLVGAVHKPGYFDKITSFRRLSSGLSRVWLPNFLYITGGSSIGPPKMI